MDQIPEIDVPVARRHLADGTATFLDIRDPDTHALGHIPGCRHVASQEELDALSDELGPDHPIVVYCYHGNSSRGVTYYLMERGHTNVHSLSGGFEAWHHTPST